MIDTARCLGLDTAMTIWNWIRSKAEGPPSGRDAAPPLPPGVKLLRTLRGHRGLIGRIAWSPDGRLLASPSEDKTIRLWNGETGECLRSLRGHGGPAWSVAFDPSLGPHAGQRE